MPIMAALIMNADTFSILSEAFSPEGHFADGMNLYQYVGSNPVNGADPLGLLYDPFEDVDQVVMALTAGRAAAAHHAFATIGHMAQRAAIMGLRGGIAALFPPYGLYLSLQGVASAIEDMLFNGLSWNNAGMLGLSVMGVRGSYGPAMMQLERIGAGIRCAYNAAGRGYAGMGMARSGFSKGPGPTNVRRFERSFAEALEGVRSRWYGTRESIRYHWEKHAKNRGLTLDEYTDDAMEFFYQNRHRAQEYEIGGKHAPGLRIGVIIEGHPGGIFTPDGKIVTFWYD